MRNWKLVLLLGVILAGSGIYSPSYIYAAENNLSIGTGKADITPPEGTPLSGYGRRHGKPSTGILDPLHARAIALSNGEKTYIFVSLDLVLVDAHLRKEILKKVREAFPLNDEDLW